MVSSSEHMNTMQDKQNEGIIELDTEDDVKRKYRNFKTFDIVQDYSDHHYLKSQSLSWQPPKSWAKRIQWEWRLLERDLPDKIFVRVYEGKMDLLRAVIIGVEGTPYCDGLFFFDVFFPTNYPNSPPQVCYHSGGLRINPNLYSSGKVCLSLLNTWRGARVEKWRPAVSTMLQVLVSIQGMVLNAKPYFNEPTYEILRGSVDGERYALHYNHQTLVRSWKTMVYSMNKPPKNFEDLVVGHFRDHASGILTACEAYYTKGIGVKYGVDAGKEACDLVKLRTDAVARLMETLVGAFKQIGVKDLDDFVLVSTENEKKKKKIKKKKIKKKKKNLTQKILECLGF